MLHLKKNLQNNFQCLFFALTNEQNNDAYDDDVLS
jgi:hypothetical protein